MIDTRTLSAALSDELRPVGFVKKGATWYLRKQDVIAVLNLQKSNYDSTHFLNLGFWLREIDDVQNPKDEQCHVRTRAEEIWPTETPNIAELLTIDATCDDAERLAAIRSFTREKVLPLLLAGTTIPGLLALLENHDGFLVRRIALDLLGLDTN